MNLCMDLCGKVTSKEGDVNLLLYVWVNIHSVAFSYLQ
jgi:hypothetical protein